MGLIFNFFLTLFVYNWKNFYLEIHLNNFFSLFNFFFNYPFFFFFGFFFLLTSSFSFLFFNFLGFYGIFFINLISIFLFWFSFLFFLDNFFSSNYYLYINFGKWLVLSSNIKIYFDFFFDNISVSFSFLTLTIGMCAYIYAYSYFRYEPNVERLLIFLNLFMISMIFLVSAGNFICLFLGWELIGITSFFLINFWVVRINTFKSAFKAFSFNKLSDAFLLFAILLVFNQFCTLDINTFLSCVLFNSNLFLNFLSLKILFIDLVSFFFILCAFIKSAQIGPHIWLPDSMEAPVPASSLIHSATLVSAGVFLILRLFPLFELSALALVFIALIGSTTAFLGGFISMHQSDTKKLLAYSTISHCGFLMLIASTGVIEYCILYLYIHGFFKAAVFMCVGNINRLNKNIQDFKKMGNFFKFSMFETFLCTVGLINLSGIPFSLGFYIKHFLFLVFNTNSLLFYILFVNSFFAALTGIFYSFRLVLNVFFDFKKARKFIFLSYNSLNFKSFFFSNSSLSSNISISLLYFLSYLFSSYFLLLYSSEIFIFSDFFLYQLNNSFFFNTISSLKFLLNFLFFNFFTLFFFIFVIFTKWRKHFEKNYYLGFFFFFFFFISFYFIFNI